MTTVLRQAGTLIFTALAATAVVAQQAPGLPAGPAPESGPATGLIVGRTLDGTSGTPVGGVVVTLNSAQAPAAPGTPAGPPATLNRFPSRLVSDDAGHFVFHDLAKGVYLLTAGKPGYADSAYGRRTPTDTGVQALILGDGDRRGDVNVSLWKFASIAGTVVDEASEPVIGLQVRILKRAVVSGRVRYTQFGNMPTTDDRGAYRAGALAPGDYVVGIVTTQTTVPTSLQQAYAAASKAGTSQDFQRELGRSAGLLNGLGAMASGQAVGSWLLQTPMGFGLSRDLAGPPIAGGKVFVYPTVFYPAAAAVSKASVIAIGSGEERNGIDLQVRPVATSRIAGMLIGPNGPEPHTVLDLMPAGADEMQRDYDLATASTTTDGTGAFLFLGVTPGSYTIRGLKIPPRPIVAPGATTVIQTGTSTISSSSGPSAQPPIPNDPTWWVGVPVSVEEADITGLVVPLRAGARITGRLEFDGAAERPAANRLILASVQIDQADGRTTSSNQFTLGRGVVDAAGQFKTYQFPPGRYVVRASGALPGWTFKGATLNGRDISDAPFELGADDVSGVVVTFTDRPAELSGTARDSKGPDSTATVLIFPAQSALWADHGPSPRRFRSVRVGSDGVYHAVSIPIGDYLVVALRSAVPSDWQDAKFLQKISPLATRVTVADGDKKSQDVETKEIR